MALPPALDGLLLMTPFVSMCPSWPDRGSACMPRRCLLSPRCYAHPQNHERFYWWVGMEACTKWWVRRCLKFQVRKTSRQTVRWPVLPIPLPNSPGVAVSVDYFGPLPMTARGNSYILLFTDRFSRRADMLAVTPAEFTAEGTASVLVNRFIPLWRFPSTLLSDNGPQFCARLATVV